MLNLNVNTFVACVLLICLCSSIILYKDSLGAAMGIQALTPNTQESISEAFLALMARSTSSFSPGDWATFMAFKESQYSARRQVVRQVCKVWPPPSHRQAREPGFGTQVLDRALVMATPLGAAYCQVFTVLHFYTFLLHFFYGPQMAKVASSTYCQHFMDLGWSNTITSHTLTT